MEQRMEGNHLIDKKYSLTAEAGLSDIIGSFRLYSNSSHHVSYNQCNKKFSN